MDLKDLNNTHTHHTYWHIVLRTGCCGQEPGDLGALRIPQLLVRGARGHRRHADHGGDTPRGPQGAADRGVQAEVLLEDHGGHQRGHREREP